MTLLVVVGLLLGMAGQLRIQYPGEVCPVMNHAKATAGDERQPSRNYAVEQDGMEKTGRAPLKFLESIV